MLRSLSRWVSSELVIHGVFCCFLVTPLQTLNFGNGFTLTVCLSFLPNTDGEYPVKFILKENYIFLYLHMTKPKRNILSLNFVSKLFHETGWDLAKTLLFSIFKLSEHRTLRVREALRHFGSFLKFTPINSIKREKIKWLNVKSRLILLIIIYRALQK